LEEAGEQFGTAKTEQEKHGNWVYSRKKKTKRKKKERLTDQKRKKRINFGLGTYWGGRGAKF